MTSMEDYVMKIKPALDCFLRNPNKDNLSGVEEELSKFTWAQLQVFHVQILLPLVLKLEKLNGTNQDLQTGTLQCIRLVVSKLYLKDLQGLRTMLIIVLKQIRDCEQAMLKPNLSEEIKLATVETISMIFQRSTSGLLEEYYNPSSALILGQILLTLVEFIEKEKYKKLVIASIRCLMAIFYVHDTAECSDVVLRSQVANTLFIFLPKIVTVLFKISLSDEKVGETLITIAVKALAQILALVFEDTADPVIKSTIDVDDFKKLINKAKAANSVGVPSDDEILGTKDAKSKLDERLSRMQSEGRSKLWFGATSRKLRIMFRELSSLRSHQSVRLRHEYAQMCCVLMQKCSDNLSDNFIFMLENVIAMAEDNEDHIALLCQQTLRSLQCCSKHDSLFDESAELLFDEHLTRLPRIISRCEDGEQYAELLFLKGFLRNLSPTKLNLLISLRRNLEMFCVCLLAAADLKITRDLLVEDYALRLVGENDYEECSKLQWRQFKNLTSRRSVLVLQQICGILGRTANLNRVIFDYYLEMLLQQSESMNEIILLLIWMATDQIHTSSGIQEPLIEILLNEILNEKHWHLALQADQISRLKVEKPIDWFVDRTPGVYESAIEIRTQDCDSDDESSEYEGQNFVSATDAKFNVLHTCIVLDAVGHCALALGEAFENYLFRSLHNVLLKVGSSNSIIYQSANFALISMQRALKFLKITHFIETYTDYITYHMNRILKRQPESKSAVDIMTVVLQFCSRNALPYLDSIFQTMREECSKSYQAQNLSSYLRVFLAFLSNVSKWQLICVKEVNDVAMQVETTASEANVLTDWLDILHRSSSPTQHNGTDDEKNPHSHPASEEQMEIDSNQAHSTTQDPLSVASADKATLPQHVQVVKDILEQVSKFVSSAVQAHQILSLECLICGLSLLQDYEDELLPLVNRFWQPLVERFRQKDAVVLNRCFTLLNLTASLAKEFIAKRSLDDVIPYLKSFLKEAAAHSETETSASQTQEYKLQMKLLRDFPNLIQKIQIEGKHLNDISEVVCLYLSQKQPKDFQQLAEDYFKTLTFYNGPLVYLIVLKRSHLANFKKNVYKIFEELEIKIP